MTPHARVYMKHFDLGEQSLITCEGCLKQGRIDGDGFDIHHINGRGKDKNVINNLMCLCRKCHARVHNGITKSEVQLIHNYFLMGDRKRFLL